MTKVMENEIERPPGQKWDLEYQLTQIHQTVDEKNLDHALDLVEQGLAQAQDDAEYQEKFTNALKEIPLNTPSSPASQHTDTIKKPQGTVSAFHLTDIKGIGQVNI